MEKEFALEDFLNMVDPQYLEFVNQTHESLTNSGCKIKIVESKSGYVVSYTTPKPKKVVINYVFRKSALVIRIYGDNFSKYIETLENMPEEMIKAVGKAPVCKRLLDPTACNSRCPMGYDFVIRGERHQKCRYNCFMFEINDENIPSIKAIVENEMTSRIV